METPQTPPNETDHSSAALARETAEYTSIQEIEEYLAKLALDLEGEEQGWGQ